jgi:hypothetical protein
MTVSRKVRSPQCRRVPRVPDECANLNQHRLFGTSDVCGVGRRPVAGPSKLDRLGIAPTQVNPPDLLGTPAFRCGFCRRQTKAGEVDMSRDLAVKLFALAMVIGIFAYSFAINS